MEKYLYKDLYDIEDTHWWHISKRAIVREALSKFVTTKTSKKIRYLDAGCGAGRNLEELGEEVEGFGIDVSAEAVSFCKKRGLRNVQQASAYDLPFKPDFFDVITMLDVLEHIDEKALVEIKRVLKPNGLVIITVPAFPWMWTRWDEVLHHQRRYAKTHLTISLQKKGFIPLRVSYLYSFLLMPTFIVRKVKSLLYAKRKDYPSDFGLTNPIINTLAGLLCLIDRYLYWHTGLPFGTSVVGVYKAVKNG